MKDIFEYKERYCQKCKQNVQTVKFCWGCGTDLTDAPLPACKHCGHSPAFGSEITDAFCRACGKRDPYKQN